MSNECVKRSTQYNGSLTREQFLFHEMRTTARMMVHGAENKDIIDEIVKDNLYQYPTTKTIKSVATACVNRLNSLDDNDLVHAIANEPSDVAKQVCLYAMMRHNRLVWEFMITVIADKYRNQDFVIDKKDLNVFFIRLQEQDEHVASWADSTIAKIKSVLRKVLVETEYLDNSRTTELNPVLINELLENAIRCNNDEIALPAFNCFS